MAFSRSKLSPRNADYVEEKNKSTSIHAHTYDRGRQKKEEENKQGKKNTFQMTRIFLLLSREVV